MDNKVASYRANGAMVVSATANVATVVSATANRATDDVAGSVDNKDKVADGSDAVSSTPWAMEDGGIDSCAKRMELAP